MAAVHPGKLAPDPHAALFDDQLYRLIAETIPHMVWTARADGATDYQNGRVYEYTGLDAARLAGWGWKSVVHPEDWERCVGARSRALEKGERYELEYRLRRADGAYRWHRASAVPLRTGDGAVFRWFGTATDIEAEVRSAQSLESMVAERTHALRESEARFRALTALSSDLYWETDSQHRFKQLAYGPRVTIALPVVEQLGRTRWEIPHGSPDEAGWAAHRATLQAHLPFSDFELSRLLPGGDERFYLVSGEPVFDEAGAFLGYRGVGREITKRKRAERALRESEQRFQAFMENFPGTAWIRDAQYRYTYVNRRYASTWGHEPAALVGRDAAELFPPATADYFRQSDLEVAREGAPIQYVDGEPSGRWIKMKFPVPDGSGGSGVAGIGLDITERVAAEDKARQYADEVHDLVKRLVETQEAERRRVAGELHDLIGQNLTALGIDLQALKHRLQAGGDLIAGPRLDAMALLLDTTIDAIRGVMTELRPAALEEFGLVPALRWYASQFSERTGIKVATKAPRREVRLPAHTELALFRIVQEALTNAAKHSGGTAVEIRIRYGDRLTLSVQDDGRGFADSGAARGARRGGFGLTTMRERAEALGGSLRVEFPERGTRVVVELPSPSHGD